MYVIIHVYDSVVYIQYYYVHTVGAASYRAKYTK